MENSKNFKPTTKQETLAFDVAKSLGDLENLPLYISYCQKYPARVIFQAFGEAKETPDSRIKKSRGALFTYLVKHFAKENNYRPNRDDKNA